MHGFLGDARSSWANAKAFWPEMLAEDDKFAGTDIYVHEYPTNASKTDLSIDELADDMRIRLTADDVLKHAHLIFIAHSMGALVVRSFLLKYRDAAARTELLYLLSPPTTGSQLAALAALINGSPQLYKMRPLASTDYLADLQRNWLAANFKFPTYCAYEKRPTFGVIVVDQSSASSLCTRALDPIDANHIDIAKPATRKSAQYEAFLNAFLENARSYETPPSKSPLTFQYARLFGALEIPLLMKEIPVPAFHKFALWEGYSVPENKDSRDAVRTNFAQFAQNLPFHDARPVLNRIWADIAGKEVAAINIFWRASSAGRNERACFYMEPLVDGGSGKTAELIGPLLPHDWESSCEPIQKEFDERIGFTFFIIENSGAENVQDIRLFFRESYSDNRVVKEFKDNWNAKEYRSSISSIPHANRLDNLFKRFSTAQATEAAVKKRPLEEIDMSMMKPGEKRIILLNIYFSGEDNLPAGYLYGIYQLEKLEYSADGATVTSAVRPPYLDKAARVAVPYGWFNQ